MPTKLLACRRGAVSVEAALVLPILVMLVVGMMEFGILLFTFSALQSAVREVTREVAVNFSDADEIEALVRERLPNWSREAAEIDVDESTPGAPTTNIITVTATLPAQSATPIHLFTQATGPWDLVTEVSMKQELPL